MPADPDRLAVRVCTDGAARGNPGPAGIGVAILGEDGEVLAEIAEGLGETTNNVAEYTAAIRGLARARELGATDVTLLSDSQLVVKQLTGEYRVKTPHIRALHDQVMKEARGFTSIRYRHVPREQNSHADRLANLGVDTWLEGRGA